MRNKRRIIIAAIVLLVIAGISASYISRAGKKKPEIIRTAVVTRSSVISSVSGNGVLQPLTTVEVKSNVGGQVVNLFVDEGDIVHTGQIIAKIDPSDSLTELHQANADLASADARVRQADESEQMQRLQNTAGIDAAKEAVEAAKQRLAQAEQQAKAQPALTQASIEQAESTLESAQVSLKQTKEALIPQKLSSTQASYDQAKANLDQADKQYARQQALLAKGFVAQSQVDTAEQQYSVAKAQLESAHSKLQTVQQETNQDLYSAEAKVKQAEASLKTAKTNQIQDKISRQELAAARASYKQSIAQLSSQKANVYQESMKRQDITQAMAQVQRARASVDNAKTQVNYTTIIAPRSGVVVKKYVEEGSIVTAGRSAFSGSGSGVTIVEIADTTRMQVLVNVDETDIAQIRNGQSVDVSIDAYPDSKFTGVVTKIAPKAIIDQNVTTIPVTVELKNPSPKLKPEMNATCDFIVARHDNVLTVPNEAVKETNKGMVVTVQENGKNVDKPVKTGIQGDDNTEIISGLNEGDTVVTAVIEMTDPTAKPTGFGGPGGGPGGPPPGMGRGSGRR